MSLAVDCERYVKALRGPANGLGQFLIDGRQSHEFLGVMFTKYGQDTVNDYLEVTYWAQEREARQ